ncbi:hypothetical protein ASF53_01185 [Methylobacterium sp. Leaf123]|uniref:hypothetical protein n=1 Tax=Methylobacterium sp. Leaf123 TaxID=1736264 RepID=UPI0006FECCCF|nr:hypothetical protein [Methylobacterium sp. Leaf123]KQQ31354.1 hypothetical protein ASF53_01185 [Methylobacterium sp. Leaf123]
MALPSNGRRGRTICRRAQKSAFLPENTPHALWTTNEPVVLQVHGSGPVGVNDLNPADDPSKAKN